MGPRAMADDMGPAVPDRSALMRMATGYLARYAASSHRLRQVLERRIGRRCRLQGVEPPEQATVAAALDPVLDKLHELGMLDDEAFAASRSRSLQRKGLPERRIRQALRHERLDPDVLETAEEPIDDLAQARRFATRKRLGPHRLGDPAPYRDKDLRSLLRAGFSFAVATAALESKDEERG